MPSQGDQDYSLLEVANQRYTDGNPLPENSGMQVVPDCGKQINIDRTGLETVVNEHYTGNQVNIDRTGLETVGKEHYTQPRRSRRKWRIIGGVAALIIVVAAVLGGVLGSMKKKRSPPRTSSTSSSSNASTTVRRQHNLAALSFPVNSVDNTRVYYQDNAGEIVEAASSAENRTWINTNLGFFAKNGSAIAAAVSRPGFAREITVLYTDSNNLIHDVIYNSATDSWTKGDLSNQKLITSANASLSVMYNQCTLCANTTIVAFQDVNNFVQISNRTSAGWALTHVNLNPINNTGLALQPHYYAGLADQINLYYQKSNLNLSLASFSPAELTNGVARWSPSSQTYSAAAAGTPIAAASSYSNVSTGYETWIQMLSLSNTGIEVDTWFGQINDWLQHDNHPSTMANSTANPKTYEAVAVTAMGKAFAAVSITDLKYIIESWQLADDMVGWTSTGVVNIDNAWD